MSDSKKKFSLVAVEITRGANTTLTVDVPEHEIRVLRAIHGDKEVKAVGPAGGSVEEQETLELAADENAEWDRLQRKYRRINSPDHVAMAFPGGRGELRGLGFDVVGAVAQEPPGAMVKKHKPEKPKAPKKPDEKDPPKDPPKA